MPPRPSSLAKAYPAGARALPVAGLHRAMVARGWTSMRSDFAADWFHPRDRGYRVWAEAFWKAIVAAPALALLGLAPAPHPAS